MTKLLTAAVLACSWLCRSRIGPGKADFSGTWTFDEAKSVRCRLVAAAVAVADGAADGWGVHRRPR